ncbi:lipopolysaccharide biosynthesis protein [Priestia megaterium]|uniref:lipopolysaccharide biosynthesis protein n=1 Tax=Priestia megaterium TaxID=1404 RepID=UPI0021D66DB7|nr:oligosaccharide flippase family protein [Priestia megaterium]MCU7740180.1 oligosaccharide flippase family protein [Priestia megaterium]
MLNKNERTLSLRTNFSWTLIGNGLYAFSQWFIVFILAKYGSPQMVGIYSLGLALSAPVLMMTNLQLRVVQATDFKNKYPFGLYFGLRIIMTILALMIIIIAMLFLNYNENKFLIILIVSLSRGIDALSDIVYGVAQKHERMDLMSRSRIIKSILIIIMFPVCMYVWGSLLAGSVAILIISIICLLFIDLVNAKGYENVKPLIEKRSFLYIIKMAFPLGVVLMLGSLYTNIPRYAIDSYLGEKELGYFTAISYFVVAGQTIITSLTQPASPRLAKIYSLGDINNFKRLLIKLCGVGLLLSVIGILASITLGEEILTILYTVEYRKYQVLFILLMLSTLFIYMGAFVGCGLTASRNFGIQPYLEGIAVLISIMASWLLIPILGLNGAAIGILIASIIQFVLKVIAIRYSLKKVTKGQKVNTLVNT